MIKTIYKICFLLLAGPLGGWQDDVDVIFPLAPVISDDQPIFLPAAHAQLRLGRYLVADANHGWRAAVEGEVAFLRINKLGQWYGHLNMETLADDHNEMSFRLVQVYYQIQTGLYWPLGPGFFTWAWQHRCSHGTDQAVMGRILIRSGPHLAYHWPLSLGRVRIDLRTRTDAYVIGQNPDTKNQARGASQLNGQLLWPIKNSWFMLIAGGFGVELSSASSNPLYNLMTKAQDWRVDTVFSTRIAMRFDTGSVRNDYALLFSEIRDTGLNQKQTKHYGLSFDINFYW